MIFRFSAPYLYILDDIKFCFHESLIFQILPSRIGIMKKIKTLQKRWWIIQRQLHQKKRNIVGNSTIRGVVNSNSFRNPGKVKVLLYVLCVETILVLHMEEKMISIDTRTPQNIRDVWMTKTTN